MQISTIIASKGGDVATIKPDAMVADVVTQLARRRIGALVVSTDGRTIAGIVSERDVVRALAAGPEALYRTVEEIMTAQVQCAPPEAKVDELMHVMTDQRVRHIPVTDPDGVLVGIVSIGDVVKSRLTELEHEHQALVDYITGG